jgi:hypothetical protein
MSYIPTLCDGCHRVSLMSMQGLSERPLECARCSQEPRVIPSRSYTAEDVEIFDELCEIVGVNLPALEAYRLSFQVERALASGSMDRVFEPLVLRWPGLVPLLAGANATRQRRSLQMLKTIFEALSMTRRSGSMARVDDLPAMPAVARVPPR